MLKGKPESVWKGFWLLLGALSLGGCAEPRGTTDERAKLDRAGTPYRAGRPDRDLPPLDGPAVAEDDLLRHAFLASAPLEAAYHRWRAAMERVPQAAAWMQPEVELNYLTSSGRMRAWDRTTLEVRQAIPTAGKRGLAAERALAEAQAARLAFEAAKFDLQMRVLSAAADYRFAGEAASFAREDLQLLERQVAIQEEKQRTGTGTRAEVLVALNMRDMAENDVLMYEAQKEAMRGDLNALLGRDVSLPLPPLAEERKADLSAPDAQFFAWAAERNPELSAMAAEVRAQENALEYARRAWVPDITLGFMTMGDVERRLMGMFTVPLQVGRIRAAIRENEAMLDETEARRLALSDRIGGRLVAALAEARDADRQVALYRDVILPRAREILESVRGDYRGGVLSAMDGIDAERTVVVCKLALVRARRMRARSVADLESIVAMDHARWDAADEKEGGSGE